MEREREGRSSHGSGSMHRSRGRRRSSRVVEGGAWARFRHDLRDLRDRYGKRTSAAHKRFVWGLVIAGAALRVWLAWQPITAGEAITYMAFAARGFTDVISDYTLPGNHVLHTLLAKCSTAIFGTNELALRIPALIGGVLALPFFYLFVRSMFNRYIALMALAMAAGLPAFAELGALAYGYSLSWLFFFLALAFGRHFVRENNMASAVLMGLCSAFAMWSVPTAVFAVIMFYLWALINLMGKYERSLSERLSFLGVSALIFIGTTILLYLPVVMAHGVDQLFRHASEGERNWKAFSAGYADKVLDYWMWVADPSYWWLCVLGFLGVAQATYVSAKYRVLLITTGLGAIPLSMGLADAGEPWQWAYAVYIFIIGGAIAMFYLLKFIQDKLVKNFGKRTRTGWASLALFFGFALPGMNVVRERTGHLPEAEACAQELVSGMRAGDRLCMDPAWEAPVGFELLERGVDQHTLKGRPDKGGLLFTVLDQPRGAPMDVIALRCDQRMADYGSSTMVKDWPRMGIFAARLR